MRPNVPDERSRIAVIGISTREGSAKIPNPQCFKK
jgi:hypothetical protein